MTFIQFKTSRVRLKKEITCLGDERMKKLSNSRNLKKEAWSDLSAQDKEAKSGISSAQS